MARRKDNHIHKYERKDLGNHVVFKCSLTGCGHYIRKELAENRISICWRCDEPFELTKAALGLKRPHCIPCTSGKKVNPAIRLKLEKLLG